MPASRPKPTRKKKQEKNKQKKRSQNRGLAVRQLPVVIIRGERQGHSRPGPSYMRQAGQVDDAGLHCVVQRDIICLQCVVQNDVICFKAELKLKAEVKWEVRTGKNDFLGKTEWLCT
jgi:hypothetical protein